MRSLVVVFFCFKCPQAVGVEDKTASYLHLARVVALGVVRSPAYFKNSGSVPCDKKQLGRMCHVLIQIHNQVLTYLTVPPDFGHLKIFFKFKSQCLDKTQQQILTGLWILKWVWVSNNYNNHLFSNNCFGLFVFVNLNKLVSYIGWCCPLQHLFT